MKELIVLRAEQAGLLGFESHAEYVFDAANPVEKKQISDQEGWPTLSSYKMPEKMFTAKVATEFLDQLQEDIAPYGEVEMDEMRKFEREYIVS
jgi:metallopeptidase MepB